MTNNFALKTVRKSFEQLTRFDWLIIGFCLFFVSIECLSWLSTDGAWAPLNPRNPYFEYYANPVICFLALAAVVIDLLVLFAIFVWKRNTASTSLCIIIQLLLGSAIALIWTELWYGSTFYYGEIRDKQGLAFSVNNFGLLGSTLFAAYLVWISPAGSKKPGWLKMLKMIIITALTIGQVVVFNLLAESWMLG